MPIPLVGAVMWICFSRFAFGFAFARAFFFSASAGQC